MSVDLIFVSLLNMTVTPLFDCQPQGKLENEPKKERTKSPRGKSIAYFNHATHMAAVKTYQAVMGDEWSDSHQVGLRLGYSRGVARATMVDWEARGLVERRRVPAPRVKWEWRFIPGKEETND